MVQRLFFWLLSLLLALPVCAEVVDIDNAELARLAAAGVPVIDIRTAGEWKETGILPGSRLLTFFDERGRADPPAWLQQLRAVAEARSAGHRHLPQRQSEPGQRVSFSRSRRVTGRCTTSREGIRSWISEGRPLTPVPGVAGHLSVRSTLLTFLG
jgi:rhodanese-related sulfurtransferase